MQLFTHLLSSYLQGMGDFFSALPRGRSTNCWPIPAFFKVKEYQQKPLPTFHKGKERHPSALNTVRWDSRPLGRVGEGLSIGRCASPATIIGGS